MFEIFKNDEYKHIRLGLYADNSYNGELNIFAELLDELPPKSKEEIKDFDLEEIKDSVDYYTKFRPLKKVKKFNLKVKVYVNGVEQITPGVNLTDNDQVEVKFAFGQEYEPTFNQYMVFIHEAEKNRDDLRSHFYNGTWYNRTALMAM